MKKHVEPVDLMVVVGLCATVLGMYLMFMASAGILGGASGATASTGRTPTAMDAMEWVQPALGQAIVENYLLEREGASRLEKAVDHLNHSLMARHYLQESAGTLADRMRSFAGTIEADHAARVQFVLGRRIVDFTSRGIRSGMLSDTQSGTAYNRSMIELLNTTAVRMHDQFADVRQSILGSEIMTAGLAIQQYGGQVQGRIGQAVMELTLAERIYSDEIAGAQEQLAKVVLTAVHTDQIEERFEQLAVADGGDTTGLSERTWPEVPGGFFLVASALLIGVFFTGLAWPTGRREVPGMEEGPAKPYRKTA